MNLAVLKFLVHRTHGSMPTVVGPVADELSVETSRELENLKAEQSPLVYVVQEKSLALLRKMEEVIVDRGQKNKAVQLSRRLLGYEKIPLIDCSLSEGGYTAGKHVKKGVRSFLMEAFNRHDANLYFIAVNAQAFADLSQDAEKTRNAAAQATRSAREGTGKGRQERDSSERVSRMGEERDSTVLRGEHDHIYLRIIQELPEPRDIGKLLELKKQYAGESIQAELVRRLILLAAESNKPVLILGETGTGKEVVAQAIHKFSQEKGQQRPFKGINCAAFPKDLLESELFGHKKGAFTGAAQMEMGLWESAGHGTLFLDEIGDLDLNHQAKILRALEEGEIRRVGEPTGTTVHARVIAATHRDIFALAEAEQFREDLCYRLAKGFLIRTPPLRDQADLIPEMATFLWEAQKPRKYPKPLPDEILDELKAYHWPGNVRQLKQTLEELDELFGHHPQLQVHHVKLLNYYRGKGGERIVLPVPAQEVSVSQFRTFDHLQRIGERLRFLRLTLNPMLKEMGNDPEISKQIQVFLAPVLGELDGICLKRNLFGNDKVFLIVNHLKAKIALLSDYLQTDSEKSMKYWKKDVFKELVAAEQAIQGQNEKVVKEASQSIDTSSIFLTADIVSIRERLAKHSHDVWAKQRRSEGWSYGPQRNDKKKEHPDLVPYESLAESEKEYDRKAAMEILRAIVALGYSVVRDEKRAGASSA